MSDPTKCPKCKSAPLLDGVPRLYCGECDWSETDELTRLRAQQTVLVEALERIDSDVKSAADHCDDRAARGLFQFVQATVREALATLDVPDTLD